MKWKAWMQAMDPAPAAGGKEWQAPRADARIDWAVRVALGVLLLLMAALGLAVPSRAQAATSAAVTLRPANPTFADTVTATVTVAGAGGQVPTGTVTYSVDGGAQQTAAVGARGANGVAFLQVAPQRPGAHTLSVSYGGDANFQATGSQSTAFTVTDLPVAVTGGVYALNPFVYTHVQNNGWSSYGISGVAVDGGGNVFVAYGLSGTTPDPGLAEISADLNYRVLPTSGLGRDLQLAADASGTLYVADPNNSRVMQYTTASGLTALNITGLQHPTSLSYEAASNSLYVIDTGVGGVIRYDLHAGTQTTLFRGVTGLDMPVTTDGNGGVFYAVGFTPYFRATDGTVTPIFGEFNFGAFEGFDDQIQGLAYDTRRHWLYVSVVGAGSIANTFVLDGNGHVINFFANGQRTGLNTANQVAVSGDRTVYGTSQVFTPGAAANVGPDQGQAPGDLAVLMQSYAAANLAGVQGAFRSAERHRVRGQRGCVCSDHGGCIGQQGQHRGEWRDQRRLCRRGLPGQPARGGRNLGPGVRGCAVGLQQCQLWQRCGEHHSDAERCVDERGQRGFAGAATAAGEQHGVCDCGGRDEWLPGAGRFAGEPVAGCDVPVGAQLYAVGGAQRLGTACGDDEHLGAFVQLRPAGFGVLPGNGRRRAERGHADAGADACHHRVWHRDGDPNQRRGCGHAEQHRHGNAHDLSHCADRGKRGVVPAGGNHVWDHAGGGQQLHGLAHVYAEQCGSAERIARVELSVTADAANFRANVHGRNVGRAGCQPFAGDAGLRQPERRSGECATDVYARQYGSDVAEPADHRGHWRGCFELCHHRWYLLRHAAAGGASGGGCAPGTEVGSRDRNRQSVHGHRGVYAGAQRGVVGNAERDGRRGNADVGAYGNGNSGGRGGSAGGADAGDGWLRFGYRGQQCGGADVYAEQRWNGGAGDYVGRDRRAECGQLRGAGEHMRCDAGRGCELHGADRVYADGRGHRDGDADRGGCGWDADRGALRKRDGGGCGIGGLHAGRDSGFADGSPRCRHRVHGAVAVGECGQPIHRTGGAVGQRPACGCDGDVCTGGGGAGDDAAGGEPDDGDGAGADGKS